MRPVWTPVPYYPKSPLSKLPPIPEKLPHKLGFMPTFLKKHFKESEQK
jgi:hypothetical protein